MTVRVPGLPALVSDLGDFAARVADTTDPDAATARALARAVAAQAPRRTGVLAGSVRAAPAGVEVTARYAPFVNAANPFVARGVDQVDPGPAYLEHLEDAAADTIRRTY